jgi:hypothetical protein
MYPKMIEQGIAQAFRIGPHSKRRAKYLPQALCAATR